LIYPDRGAFMHPGAPPGGAATARRNSSELRHVARRDQARLASPRRGNIGAVEELTLAPAALGTDPGAPIRARRQVGSFLTRQGLHARLEDVLLVVSELVTNSVLHAQAAPELVVRAAVDSASVLVEVRDPSPLVPVARVPDVAVRGGRGMGIVSAVADRWGVKVRGEAGKTIWAEFRTAPS
jgi:anti-sigma regulatory factor (Ser/Thr protein kinase)